MSYTIFFKMSPDLEKMLGEDANKFLEGMVNEAAFTGERIIKMPGYAPVGSKPGGLKGFGPSRGHLRDRHQVIGSGTQRQIVNDVNYLKHVLGGHRVLTTPKSRRWWFWYLRTQLGGQYTRKTSGPRGWVPPNNYPARVVFHLIKAGYLHRIGEKWARRFVNVEGVAGTTTIQ